MSNYVIERPTRFEFSPVHGRMSKPMPGDTLRFEKDGTTRFARIETVSKEGVLHVCCQNASVFQGDGYVSISGGPWASIPKDRWRPVLGAFKTVSFWTWPNGRVGAGEGVTYYLSRPVFDWIDPTESEVRCL